MPPVSNVLAASIQICILLGMKEINFYGADHNFFHTIAVNGENQLVGKYVHWSTKIGRLAGDCLFRSKM
jgi:hypothetical protein